MFPQTKSGKGRFIIGNHADEMQPWIPLLASLTNAEYLSIPCCAWDFDTRFQMKKKGRKELGDNEGQGDDDGPEAGTPEEVELERKLRYDEKDGKMSLYAGEFLKFIFVHALTSNCSDFQHTCCGWQNYLKNVDLSSRVRRCEYLVRGTGQ